MNSGQVDSQECLTNDELLNLYKQYYDKLNHDIRGSLAITNGFNLALESSFSELCEAYEQLLGATDASPELDAELPHRVGQLEADCRFCLSRISRSLEQLGTRIDSDSRLHSHISAPKGVDIQ